MVTEKFVDKIMQVDRDRLLWVEKARECKCPKAVSEDMSKSKFYDTLLDTALSGAMELESEQCTSL